MSSNILLLGDEDPITAGFRARREVEYGQTLIERASFAAGYSGFILGLTLEAARESPGAGHPEVYPHIEAGFNEAVRRAEAEMEQLYEFLAAVFGAEVEAGEEISQ